MISQHLIYLCLSNAYGWLASEHLKDACKKVESSLLFVLASFSE